MSQEAEKTPQQRADIDEIEETQHVEPDDEQAQKEEEDLFKRRAKVRKDSKWRHLHFASVALIWVGVGLVVITLLSRMYHMLMPEDWFWLTGRQIVEMDRILFSGFIGGILARFIPKLIIGHQD